MASLALGTYIALTTGKGVPTGYAFQNFFHGQSRLYDGMSYMFAGFGFSGSAVDVTAANITASLVFGVNQLDLNVFKMAADERWIAQVRTVWLDPDSLEETSTYLEEIYAITGFEHDTSRLSVRLSSPLDAVTSQAPRRTLNQALVGALPGTGSISMR
jgi:hypothetical protein